MFRTYMSLEPWVWRWKACKTIAYEEIANIVEHPKI
jgi:hypothetical protein